MESGSGIRGQHPAEGVKGIKLQMEEESLQRRWKCKRQLEGAEGEGGVRGWVEDAAAEAASERIQEEEAERRQQQRQHHWQRRSQVQQQEALEGAAGEPAGEEAPQEEHRGNCWQEVEMHTKEGAPYGWKRAYSLPPSLSHHSLEAQGEAERGLDSDARLAVWRHTERQRRHKERQRRHKEKQRRQLGAAGVPAAEAMQPGAAGEARQGGEVEAARAKEEDLPPVHHKAWEAESAEWGTG